MRLPFVGLVEVVRECRCEVARTDVRGRCRRCGGRPEHRREPDLPYREVWWPFSEEENRR